MASLNRVQLIGRLGKDPDSYATKRGIKGTHFSVAVDRRWRDAEGKTQRDTDWFNVEAWGRLAEVCEKYLQKGRLVYIEGRLQTEHYESGGEMHYTTKVVARQVQMLDRRPEEETEVPDVIEAADEEEPPEE
ncbi:MAG: single-strand binding protein [Chloroflexi bacterium]|jgi:single-strand DNA-binding protein|nr:single-strand binding protein [Chloroflexota bacterium]